VTLSHPDVNDSHATIIIALMQKNHRNKRLEIMPGSGTKQIIDEYIQFNLYKVLFILTV
jgi:hypothetical protein